MWLTLCEVLELQLQLIVIVSKYLLKANILRTYTSDQCQCFVIVFIADLTQPESRNDVIMSEDGRGQATNWLCTSV